MALDTTNNRSHETHASRRHLSESTHRIEDVSITVEVQRSGDVDLDPPGLPTKNRNLSEWSQKTQAYSAKIYPQSTSKSTLPKQTYLALDKHGQRALIIEVPAVGDQHAVKRSCGRLADEVNNPQRPDL